MAIIDRRQAMAWAGAALAGCAALPAMRRTSSADGVPIAYTVQGRGGAAVVLVHGWACDGGYWAEQVPVLKERYVTVTLDLGGHGASGSGRARWSIASYGADVAAVVAALKLERVVLVGHSMGGPVVVAASQQLPAGTRLDGLVVVDSLKNVGLPPPPPAARDAILRPFDDDFAAAMRSNVRERMFRPDADPALVERIAGRMAAADPGVARAMLQALFAPSWEADLPRIRVPLVAINADLGGSTDDARIRRLAPTFRSVTLPGTGHFMMIEQPVRFNAALLEQLALIEREAAR